MPSKRWFDDWELGLTAWDDGRARIDITLPHNDVTVVQIWTTKRDMQQQANVFDKLLCQLTGTKTTRLINGRDTATPT